MVGYLSWIMMNDRYFGELKFQKKLLLIQNNKHGSVIVVG